MKQVGLLLIAALLTGLAVFSFIPADTRVEAKNEYYQLVGVTYTGTMEKGVLNGYGKMVFDNGAYYEGMFRDGLFDGKGVFVSESGKRLEGVFSEGRLIE
ncbi:hypothetical protein FACS1894202_03530 [Clostridia bacterium]|nr:hypothetical protein FACS1894202_03530 [Clostridia bacterium]